MISEYNDIVPTIAMWSARANCKGCLSPLKKKEKKNFSERRLSRSAISFYQCISSLNAQENLVTMRPPMTDHNFQYSHKLGKKQTNKSHYLT